MRATVQLEEFGPFIVMRRLAPVDTTVESQHEVTPDAACLVRRMSAGGLLLLCGARGVGKRSAVEQAMNELRKRGFKPFYVDLTVAALSTSPGAEGLWKVMDFCLSHVASSFGRAPEAVRIDSVSTFGAALSRASLGDAARVVLVLDEMQQLLFDAVNAPPKKAEVRGTPVLGISQFNLKPQDAWGVPTACWHAAAALLQQQHDRALH